MAAYFQIAKCYEALENWDLARNYYDRILAEDEPESIAANAARYQLLYIALVNEEYPAVIDTTKNKTATAKNSAGNVLEYRIILSSNIIINNYLTGDEILNQNFSYSSAYRVQDNHSETIKIENMPYFYV